MNDDVMYVHIDLKSNGRLQTRSSFVNQIKSFVFPSAADIKDGAVKTLHSTGKIK